MSAQDGAGPRPDGPAPQNGDDSVLPFQLDALDVRGRVARLDETIDTILTQHDYPAPISGLVAEAMLLTALIGQTIKLRNRYSIQARGKGIVSLIATDYFAPTSEGAPARIRGYAAYDAERFAEEGGAGMALLGEGVMGMMIDQGTGQPYQGITPLSGDSLAACAETYFAQSEQLATRFALASAQASEPGQAPRWRAGGVVIQHMPKASPLMDKPPSEPAAEAPVLMSADDVASLSGEEDLWRTAALKLDTVDSHELIGPFVEPERLLLRLFHEDAPRVYPPQAVEFGCTCSREKLHNVLTAYGRETLEDLAEDGQITGDCQFCGAKYAFELSVLLASDDQE